MTAQALARASSADLVLRVTPAAQCSLCGQDAAPLGLGMFLDQEPLCAGCGAKRAPALVELLRLRERLVKSTARQDPTARYSAEVDITTVYHS